MYDTLVKVSQEVSSTLTYCSRGIPGEVNFFFV